MTFSSSSTDSFTSHDESTGTLHTAGSGFTSDEHTTSTEDASGQSSEDYGYTGSWTSSPVSAEPTKLAMLIGQAGGGAGGNWTITGATLEVTSADEFDLHVEGDKTEDGAHAGSESSFTLDIVGDSALSIYKYGDYAGLSWSLHSYTLDGASDSLGTYHEQGNGWWELWGGGASPPNLYMPSAVKRAQPGRGPFFQTEQFEEFSEGNSGYYSIGHNSHREQRSSTSLALLASSSPRAE